MQTGQEETITVGGKSILRFHPLNKRIKDGVPRCMHCGQVDEPDIHEQQWCPGHGGDLPFPTSSLKMTLKADNGYRAEVSARITLRQWTLISMVLSAEGGRVRRPILDQDGEHVGMAYTPIAELMNCEGAKDEDGIVWTPPTADAYRAVCKALAEKDARIVELLAAAA